jgi:ubiquinone/menaquinone biosynthesis C-methylase UbiE
MLDVGCGDGYWTTRLANSCKANAYGIDQNHTAIEKANRYRSTECTFLLASVDSLPFEDNLFHVVISLSALQFFKDAASALKEIRRVMRHDGLVIITSDAMDYHAISLRFRQLHQQKYFPVTYYSSQRLVSHLQTAGFRVLKTARWIHSPLSSNIMYLIERFGKIMYFASPILLPLVLLSDKLSRTTAGGHTAGIMATVTTQQQLPPSP